jgi:hypothetical protein
VPCPAVIAHPLGTVQVYVLASGTVKILYACPVKPGHWADTPVIVPGVAGVDGLSVTVSEFAVLAPQELPAVTEMLPFWPAVPQVTVIAVVPCPAVIVHPVGTAHVYVVALGTAVML